MQNLALIAPLIVLIPAIGAFINFTLGPRLSERFVSIIGTTASGLTFGCWYISTITSTSR
jgi:hypothetical protein